MFFNPSHCELCGNTAREYFFEGALLVCESCAAPEVVAGARALVETKRERGRPRIETGLTARERNIIHRTAYLEEHPCVDCQVDDAVVLEFDHIPSRGPKKYNVGRMVQEGRPLDVLIAEMEKCEVVCANCHKRRTQRRRIHERLRSQGVRVSCPIS